MNRRQFIVTTAAAGMAGLAAPGWLQGADAGAASAGEFDGLLRDLLRDWCDGLLRLQVVDPDHPASNGAFRCPACGFFHGRCGDAVLPLLAMAGHSGEVRYLEAALRVAAWTKNVDAADGSWTNELDPKSWKGTTVFTAIAFAEALEWHGKLLDEGTRAAWRERLKRAGEFIFRNVDVAAAAGEASVGGKPTNINYGVSGAYALALLGRLLEEERFYRRGEELAQRLPAFFTSQNQLLFGEGHPAQLRSPKGCQPIDLGYNVEESLPNLVHYALLAGDQKILATAVASLKTHLEFLLPDGGWDNSWGTRSFKWTYWGSRTSDGCQSAFVRLAARDPVFATAARRNAEQFRACTHDGLLHGGPHYARHQVNPCVHHTFTHAKALAGALHYRAGQKIFPALPPLPRAGARGVKYFPETDVHLAALGPWRATFSGYDWSYAKGLFHALGGAPGILWHEKLGPVLSASLARYLPVEALNMQTVPDGEDFPLTLRVERRTADGGWFTNLHDGQAKIRHESSHDDLRFVVETRLLSADQADPTDGPWRYEIRYTLTGQKFTVSVLPQGEIKAGWSLVVPVIARSDEAARQTAPNRWEITKPAGRLIVSAGSPIERLPTRRERVFNLVPGFEALPLQLGSNGMKPVDCTLEFLS